MKAKSIGIDILRILSMICVVALHSMSNGLRVNFDANVWSYINILSSFATCAVPIFFMISGYLILNSSHTDSISYTLLNRVPRLIAPLFVWSVIYIIISANMDFYNRDIPLDAKAIWENIFMFVNKERAVHFWFMYYLIPLYLIAPFLKAACDKAEDRVIIFILSLWGIMLVLNVLAKLVPDEYEQLFSIGFLRNIDFVGGYGGYFLLGRYIGKMDFKQVKLKNIICVTAIIISVFVIAKGTAYYTELTGEYDEWIKSYSSIAVCILSCGVFILLKDVKLNKGKGVIAWLSSLCYGVYLCHNIFLYIVSELGLGRLTGYEMFRNFSAVLIISVVLIAALSQIKYIDFIFTGISKK